MRLFVYDCPDDDGARRVGDIVNPVLERLEAPHRRPLDEGEGCLSVPGAVMPVPRPDRAAVRGVDTGDAPARHHRGHRPAARREEVFARRAANIRALSA
ncbi:peptide deformylase [Streptomyces sp. DI166]|nr:peptide deformylase [Streptomyces sp. DI166]